MSNSDSVFDRVLHSVGDDGKFQTRCNIVFNFLLGVFSTMAYMTLILALVVPDHWCKVPGREDGNYSLEEWKLMTLPRVNNSAGQESFSSCQMFNNTQEDSGKTTVINCQYGYEYDTTWFYNTLASEQDWVCEKEIYISNVLGAGKLAEVLAGFVFGYLGDTIGRRKVYILSLCIICFGRIVSLFVVDYYYIFMAATVIASLPSTTPIQSAIVIIMELSTNEDRSYILQLYNFGWSTGLALMAFVYWITDDWFYYMLASSTPLMIYIPLSILFVESPRWLLSRGRVPECLQQLIKIAKVNGTRLSPDAALLLQNAAPKPEKVYGIGSILSNKKLAKMTILLTTCWICASVNYYLLVLVVGSLSGNPFLNFFLQAIAEIPSYVLGRFISETLGRRFSCACGFLLGMCGLITITITIHDTSLAWFHLTLFILSKFAVTTALFVVYLQSVEIYPTCVRQGGFNFVVITGGVAIIGAPYCVYLGVLYDSRIPYLISIGLCILGLITQIFLPETLHEKLPETLHEAKTFGDDQCYWSFPRKKADLYVLANLQHVDRQMSDNNDADD